MYRHPFVVISLFNSAFVVPVLRSLKPLLALDDLTANASDVDLRVLIIALTKRIALWPFREKPLCVVHHGLGASLRLCFAPVKGQQVIVPLRRQLHSRYLLGLHNNLASL